jgi:hypothetical protein
MRNRGPGPKDDQLFAARYHAALRAAADDLSWLLERHYGIDSALQLVGNRYRLNQRQRQAVARVAAAPSAVVSRQHRRIPLAEITGRRVAIDGFNLLILLETALSGGYIFCGKDGTYRDLSSVHGSYKRVRQTQASIHRVGEALRPAAVVTWYFDAPVSNSGRLKTILREIGEKKGYNWSVELVNNPDRDLVALPDEVVIVTSDSWVLDHGGTWCNLGRELLHQETEIRLFSC